VDLLAWVLGLAVVASAHVAVSLDAVAPVQTKDEIGYLAAARLLATGEGAGLLTPEYAGGYAAGWGLLTAPLWWLTSHPPTVYTASVAVDVVLSVLLLLPATAVARLVGLRTPLAVLAATVCCVGAGRLGYTGYALPEPLLTVQLTTLLWLLLRLHQQPLGGTTARAGASTRAGTTAALAGTALLLAWLPTTHARFLPTAVLGIAVLAWWARTRRRPDGAAAVLVAAAGVAAGWWLNGHVEAVLYGDVARAEVAAEQLGGLRVADVLTLLVGHAWYAATAWLGLSVLGWWSAVTAAAVELRDRRPGPWTWLAVGSLLQLGVGAAYLSGRLDIGGRVDQLVYGRYGDPVWFVLALVGTAWLLGAARPARVLVAAGACLALLAPAALLVLRANRDRVSGFVQLNVPGLEAWAWRVDDRFVVPWAPATLLATAVLTVLAVAALRSGPGRAARAVAVGLTGVVLLGAALVAEQRNIEPRDAWIRSMFGVRALVQTRPGAPVLLVVDRPLLLSGNALQWWLADRDTVVVEPGALPAAIGPGALVVGPSDLPPAGGQPLGSDGTGRYTVWELGAAPGSTVEP